MAFLEYMYYKYFRWQQRVSGESGAHFSASCLIAINIFSTLFSVWIVIDYGGPKYGVYSELSATYTIPYPE